MAWKAAGGARVSGTAGAPETMVFISSPQLRMTFEWWHIYAPGSPHTSVALYGRRVQEA